MLSAPPPPPPGTWTPDPEVVRAMMSALGNAPQVVSPRRWQPLAWVKKALSFNGRAWLRLCAAFSPVQSKMVRIPQPNKLRAWREFRRMTQAQLAESVDTTGAVISLLESGDRGLSDKWLRRLAPVLGTTPGHLLDIDPNDVQIDILEYWANIPEESRPQVLEIIRTFRKDAPVLSLRDAARARTPESEQPQQTKRGRPRKGPQRI